MAQKRTLHWCLIFVFVIILGLGTAIVLPILAKAQNKSLNTETQIGAPSSATRYYVAITGTGSGGLSWTDAFTNVQDALVVATDPSEIWVAEGVYYPDVGSGQIDDAVTSTYLMTQGVTLYGGFEYGDTDLNDRDWENNLTILSGDVEQNDHHTAGVVLSATDIVSDNVYHVVTAREVSGTTALDGFIITAGNATTLDVDGLGGGFYCDGRGTGCSPILRNIGFYGNFGSYGGGYTIAVYKTGTSSSPSLENIRFQGNSAGLGGGIYILCSDVPCNPKLTNITFSNNSALLGGAMINNGTGLGGAANPILTNVEFSGNSAESGGGLYNYSEKQGITYLKLTNGTFSGNFASGHGGGIYSVSDSGACLMEMNNSILWNNQDSSGTGIITSSIFLSTTASVSLTNSLVEGSGGSGSWIGGEYKNGGDNIDTDPLFITPVDPATAPTAAGDLRLTTKSPAIDAGEDDFIDLPFDLDNKPRKVDGNGDGEATVDMGAYEYQPLHLLTVIKSGTGNGTVTSTPASINCGDTCSSLFTHGSKVTLAAVPNSDSVFSGWSGDCGNGDDCELSIDGAKSVTATFDLGIANYLPLVKR